MGLGWSRSAFTQSAKTAEVGSKERYVLIGNNKNEIFFVTLRVPSSQPLQQTDMTVHAWTAFCFILEGTISVMLGLTIHTNGAYPVGSTTQVSRFYQNYYDAKRSVERTLESDFKMGCRDSAATTRALSLPIFRSPPTSFLFTFGFPNPDT